MFYYILFILAIFIAPVALICYFYIIEKQPMQSIKCKDVIAIFDVDGTLTHVPGGKCIDDCGCLWSQGWDKFQENFLSKKQIEVIYLQTFINLLRNSGCKVLVCTNNNKKTVEDFFAHFGLEEIEGRFRNDKRTKQEFVNNYIDVNIYVNQDTNQDVEQYVCYFEDDSKYFEGLDSDVHKVNCEKRWLGSQLYELVTNLRYNEDISNDLQGLYKFLLKLCENETGIRKVFDACPWWTEKN